MKIIFTRGLLVGNVADFTVPHIRIGRGEENELCLMTDGVSRQHGELRRNNSGVWTISDLGSTNGIKVNGVRITAETEVHEGDDIEVGEQCMRIDLSDEESHAADPRFAGDVPEVRINVPASGGGDAAPAANTLPVVEFQIPVGVNGAEQKKSPSRPAEDESFSAMLKDAPRSFFNSDARPSSDHGSEDKSGRNGAGRILKTAIFYLSIAAIVVSVISFCIRNFSNGKTHGHPAAGTEVPAKQPFVFTYERTIFSRDNIFRFALTVEDNAAEMVLDDIRHNRSVPPRRITDSRGIGSLRESIRASGIMHMSQPAKSREKQSVQRRITVVADGKICEFEIDGEYVSSEVERVEAAVDDFAAFYGLKTISFTPEQLRELAEESFAKAEDLFENREADYGNLREAIIRYTQAKSYLEQFSPRPQLWARAAERLETAVKLRKERFNELNAELVRQEKLGDKAQMRQLLKQIMDLVDEDTRQYEQAHRKLFLISNPGIGNR